jgi:predicted MFS family arabinose efflux permease
MAGGRRQLRTIVLLASALALAAGDQTVVGAVAPDMKVALGIGNTEVGLLITAASLVGAATTLPFGLLADRVARVRLLAICVLTWSASVGFAGAAASYLMILCAQLALGAGIGAATPLVASLTGDLFPAAQRGRVYALILAGEFLGAAAALVMAGQVAAWWSWRGSFWVLVVPGPILAIALIRLLPEPARGGFDRAAGNDLHGHTAANGDATLAGLVHQAGVAPHETRVLTEDPASKSLGWAIRYVLSIRTNVLLIVASALAYYYVAGLQAFIVVFLRGRYDFGQGTATMLLVLVGVAVVIGTLVTGPLSDRLVARGRIASRPVIGGLACLWAACWAVPGLAVGTFAVGFPILLVAAVGMGGANPPLDAARLDIMHSRLWGRAESVRNFVQTLFKSSAPLLFGYLSVVMSPVGSNPDQVQGGGAEGLTRAMMLMLGALLVAGVLLLVFARRTYPRDVATAIASERTTESAGS